MSFSNYLENKVLLHVFGATAYTAPATLYVGLYTSTLVKLVVARKYLAALMLVRRQLLRLLLTLRRTRVL